MNTELLELYIHYFMKLCGFGPENTAGYSVYWMLHLFVLIKKKEYIMPNLITKKSHIIGIIVIHS